MINVKQLGLCMMLFAATTACSIGLYACSDAASDARYTSLVVKKERILLAPNINAGSFGWCVVWASGGSCSQELVKTPILFESWNGAGRNIEGYAVLSKDTDAVSFDGGPPVTRLTSAALPDGLRSVVMQIRGLRGPQRSGLVALGRRGKPIHEVTSRVRLFGKELVGSASRQLRDACEITVRPFGDIKAKGGSVVTRVAPRHSFVEPSFLSCASTSYKLGGWSLLAGVLIDAANPGITPPKLPAMRPVQGRHGLYEVPSFEGDVIARRVPAGWLVVSGGKRRQREALLDHLLARVNVG